MTWGRPGTAAGRPRVKGDMKRFKEFIEHRGSETGAWRDDVDRPGS